MSWPAAISFVAMLLAGCLVNADALSGGNAVGGACKRHAQCDPGLVCSEERCALPATCLALAQARPEAVNGTYELAPDATGVTPRFSAFCEQNLDGGGWMQISANMLGESREQHVTVDSAKGEDGGLMVTVYANAEGCGEDASFHMTLLSPGVPWTEVRFRQVFSGRAQCYGILGIRRYVYSGKMNVVPFDLQVDRIWSQSRMAVGGGSFDGLIETCDSSKHFWNQSEPLPSSIEVSLRRIDLSIPSGIGTGVSCNSFAPGNTSPTWWRYDKIFVR